MSQFPAGALALRSTPRFCRNGARCAPRRAATRPFSRSVAHRLDTSARREEDEGPRRYRAPGDPQSRPRNPYDAVAVHRHEQQYRAYWARRMKLSALGLALCIAATAALRVFYPPPDRTEAPPEARFPSADSSVAVNPKEASAAGAERGPGDATNPPPPPPPSSSSSSSSGEGQVPTGASAVPFFPRTVSLPSERSTASAALPAGTGEAPEEFHLLGLGVRTVSFLSIKVYVVGLYVAAGDLGTLQARFVRRAAEVQGASTLVAGEKAELRRRLLDPRESERLWNEVLAEGGIRSLVRVVPVRSSDFGHLRDGWLRAISARTAPGSVLSESPSSSSSGGTTTTTTTFDDEEFGRSVFQFKQIFTGGGRKGVGVGKALMLERGADGHLSAWIQTTEGGGGGGGGPNKQKPAFARMGRVEDERISRLVWLGYLGGKTPASEQARTSIVDGVLELVERPVGTAETQVI